MACRTELEGYLERESETLQDVFADKPTMLEYFKDMTFANISTARKLLRKLNDDNECNEVLIAELKKKIQDYEDFVESEAEIWR